MSTVIATPDDLYDLIRELGDTPDAVAQHLRAAGVTGEREAAGSCPIANWIRITTGIIDVDVEGDVACVTFPDATDLADEVRADLPDAASDFVVAFDRGDYPDLDAGGDRP